MSAPGRHLPVRAGDVRGRRRMPPRDRQGRHRGRARAHGARALPLPRARPLRDARLQPRGRAGRARPNPACACFGACLRLFWHVLGLSAMPGSGRKAVQVAAPRCLCLFRRARASLMCALSLCVGGGAKGGCVALSMPRKRVSNSLHKGSPQACKRRLGLGTCPCQPRHPWPEPIQQTLPAIWGPSMWCA